MTDQQYFWYMIVQVFVAAGTVGAVIVALVQAFKGKFWPPKVRLSLLSEAGEKTKYSNPAQGQDPAVRYYHVRVKNDRSWSPATDLSVHLVRVDKPGPDDTFQVVWSGDIPIRCRDQEIYPLKQMIGNPIEYDICRVDKRPAVLSLLPIIFPNNLKIQWTGSLKLNLLLQVKCSENSSAMASVQIAWDGDWDDGDAEMKKHFKIKVSETAQT